MISIRDFNFSYTEQDTANNLKNINLDIKQGECVLFIGKSGSGKTTLSRTINGLIPHFYDGSMSGEVSIDDVLLSQLNMTEISKKVGSVFQNPRSQFFNLDTITEIAFGLENNGIAREELHKKVAKAIDDLAMQHLIGKNIFSLSGGEKQLIAIASTYALGSDIFVMDEPSANLDFDAIDRLGEMIGRLKAHGKTVIVAEHRVYYLKNVFDRCIYVENGQIKHDYAREEYLALSQKTLAQLGLRSMILENITFHRQEAKQAKLKNPPIEINNLFAKYKGSKEILKDINFQLNSAEITCVIGKNGAGKSTLASVLCGLMKETKGQVKKEIVLKTKDRVGNFYLIMQESSNQLFSDSVFGELKLSFEKSVYSDEQLIELLQHFSLDDYVDRHPLSLSGGEKQRLAIATAIIANSDVIVFDEPTSGLDYANMQKVKEIMQDLAKHNKYILIITHDYEFIMQVADKVIIMEDGNVTQSFSLNNNTVEMFKNYFTSTRNKI